MRVMFGISVGWLLSYEVCCQCHKVRAMIAQSV
jgi:hypothetical protein